MPAELQANDKAVERSALRKAEIDIGWTPTAGLFLNRLTLLAF
jgi:hypothetical protein